MIRKFEQESWMGRTIYVDLT